MSWGCRRSRRHGPGTRNERPEVIILNRRTAAPGSHLDERWLTIEQLSERLSIPTKTLRDWRLRNYGPPGIRLGRGVRGSGSVRYRLSDVEAWEAARERAEAAGGVT
jgi:Helix-turn-helix domain